MKSNYDCPKTMIRKTTKNYHLRADDPLLIKIWRKKRMWKVWTQESFQEVEFDRPGERSPE